MKQGETPNIASASHSVMQNGANSAVSGGDHKEKQAPKQGLNSARKQLESLQENNNNTKGLQKAQLKSQAPLNQQTEPFKIPKAHDLKSTANRTSMEQRV